jgi:Domain of unknown function (DUF2019)
MTKPDLSTMPTPDLVREFIEIALQQSYAEAREDFKRFRELYDSMTIIAEELKTRHARHELAILFDHPNLWVRYKAAVHTLAILPEEARSVLEDLKAKRLQPAAAHAFGLLRALDNGSYVPD